MERLSVRSGLRPVLPAAAVLVAVFMTCPGTLGDAVDTAPQRSALAIRAAHAQSSPRAHARERSAETEIAPATAERAAQTHEPSLVERLNSIIARVEEEEAALSQSAVSAPEAVDVEGPGEAPAVPTRAGDHTAIYDIAAHAVYLPNGDKLEAHSGLGPRQDDPRSVNVKNRGAT